MIVTIAAWAFALLMGILILFQACLAAGLPWGAASMGGRFPGRYPPKMRIAAALNMAVLAFIGLIVLARAGLFLRGLMPFSRIALWAVIPFFAAQAVMNAITPSRIERIWAPVALLLLICCIIIAFG